MTTPDPIYLDYAATTPVDPAVAEKMSACLTMDGNFGNPASRSHMFGWQAEAAVEEARREVAELIKADPREIVWTSGATESDNLAIKGAARGHRGSGRHIVASSIEHKAVLDTCRQLEAEGFSVTYISPVADGLTTPKMVEAALRPDTILVSIMHANNELGAVNDIAGIARLTRARGILFHTDAAQSAGKIPIDTSAIEADLISLTAHKMYGPKGIGALFVRRRPPVPLAAEIHGGGHERGMRSGTLPTHQIVGMGEAARIARENMADEAARIAALRDKFWSRIKTLGGITLNGSRAARLPGILNFSVAGVDGEALLLALGNIAVSTGSACNSADLEPSHVLRAMNLPEELARSSIRLSLGRFTTAAEITQAADSFLHAVPRLRESA